MNIMQKVLTVMERDKSYYTKEVLKMVEAIDGMPLNYSQKSSLRTALFQLSQTGMMLKEKVGDFYWYTLIKDKSEYAPIRGAYTPKENRTQKKRPVKKRETALEWFSLRTLGHIETLSKNFSIPKPRTRNEIESFYHTVKSKIK